MPINLQGKEYVTHEELVQWATETGLKSVETEILHIDIAKQECVVQATASGERGTYQGLGDCLGNVRGNVGKMITAHFIRMAETRAVNRALRLYTGRGATSADELGDTSGASGRGQPPTEHHASWTDDERRGFMGALSRLSLDYEKQVKPYCLAQGWGKPSTWPSEQRRQLVNDIESGNVRIGGA